MLFWWSELVFTIWRCWTRYNDVNICFTNDNVMPTLSLSSHFLIYLFLSLWVCVFARLHNAWNSRKSVHNFKYIHIHSRCKTWNGMKRINWIDAEHDEWHASQYHWNSQLKVMKSGKCCVCVYNALISSWNIIQWFMQFVTKHHLYHRLCIALRCSNSE